MALQLRDEPGHATCRREHWLEDIFDVCNLQFRKHHLRVVFHKGD